MARYKVINTPFYIVTVFSLTLLLLILGWTMTSFVLSGEFVSGFKEKINIIAELNDENDHQTEIIQYLKQNESVVESSVQYISKETALSRMEVELGSSILSDGMENPFQEVIQFNLKADHLSLSQLDILERSLKKEFDVSGLYYPPDLFSGVQRTLKSISLYGAIFVLVLFLIVIFLIHQIIKMNIISNRFVIRTMEMVGAKSSFIRRPFRSEALRMGAISSILAIVIYASSILFIPQVKKLSGFDFLSPSLLSICGTLFILGIGICLISSRMALAKYLNAGLDKFH